MRRLLHISDIHFGPPHLPSVGAGLLQLVRSLELDVVVLSGDLTQRAKPYQFRQAAEYLSVFPVPVVAVPGNHDVPLYRVWERIFAPYGVWRREYGGQIEPVQTVTSSEGDLVVVGLNSSRSFTTKHGRIKPSSIERLQRALGDAKKEAVRVVTLHHPLTKIPGFDEEPVVRNASRLLSVLAEHDVRLVLSGHLHQTFVLPLQELDKEFSPAALFAQCGTTTSSRGRAQERGRNSCLLFELEREVTRVTQQMWNAEVQRFEPLESWRFGAGHSA